MKFLMKIMKAGDSVVLLMLHLKNNVIIQLTGADRTQSAKAEKVLSQEQQCTNGSEYLIEKRSKGYKEM